MALIANNISGSASNSSKIGITGSVIFANNPGSSFPSFPNPTVTFFVSGSNTSTGADNPSIVFKGDSFVSGAAGVSDYFQMKPVGPLRIPTNTTASYIYTSGSTNDLYFTQYQPGTGYTNTTRLRWLEGSLHTGLLHGGVLSTEAGTTTFSMTSGSGLIVNYNASTTTDPYPTIQYLEWPSILSQSLTYVTSSQITYIGINPSGGAIQRTTPFSDGDYLDYISIGRILHQSGSVTNAAVTNPTVAYGNSQQHSHFTRAFGPLKISGHVLAASGSTLSLTKTSGDAYAEGRNYRTDPDDPNYTKSTSDAAVTVSKIYREYTSGSSYRIDTGIANAGYTTIDPTLYNPGGLGTLSAVAAGQYSIQRTYWFPNSVDRAFYVYYGNATYNSLDSAEAAINTETFTESENTRTSAILVAYILVKGNATDLSNTSQARIVQAGLFRGGSLGGGGGGAGSTTPGGLDTYVQFNDGGSTFGGDAEFTYNKTTNILTVGDVSVGDSGLISTSNTTANVFNTNSTTINFAGAASTALNIGNSSGTNTVSGQTKFSQGLSGSLTKLVDGTSYLIAGNNMTITTGSNGAVTVNTTGTAQTTSAFVTIGNDASLTNERALTAGTGLILTDGGANSTVTLGINNSVVATVSGTQFTGNVGVTGSLGASSLGIAGGVLYQSNGIIQQNGNLIWDATNSRLGIGVAAPTRQLQVLSGFRFGGNTDYYELITAGGGIIRWTPGGAITTLEINNPMLFPPAKTLGFTPSLGSLTIDSGFSRAASGIINVSGSAPGALFRFNATSTPTVVGDLGMNVSSGRPVMYTTGSARQVAHMDEVAMLTGATFTGAVKFNIGLSGSLTQLTDGTSYLIAGSNTAITTGSNGSVTVASTTYSTTTISAGTNATAAPALLTTLTIPANTYKAGDLLLIEALFTKTGSAGGHAAGIYINTSNTLTGAITIVNRSQGTAAIIYQPVTRRAAIIVAAGTGNGTQAITTNSLDNDFAAATTISPSTLAIDWTQTQYLMTGATVINNADSVKCNWLKVSSG